MAVADYNKTKKLEATSQNDSGSTIDKAQPISVIGEVTPKEFDGFEDGDYTSSPQWTEEDANGTATVQSTTVKNGSNALELSTSGSGQERLQHDRGTSDSINDGDKYTIWVNPSQTNEGLFYSITNSQAIRGGNDEIAVAFTSSGVIRLVTYDGTGSQIEQSNVFNYSANEWYRITLEINPGGSEASIKIYDGSNSFLGSATNSTSGASSLTYVQLANRDLASGTFYVDDVSYSETDASSPYIAEEDTGTGSIILDWTNISNKSDIAVYDQNGNLLDYEIEELDTTAETAVLWCYNSWVRDGSTQAQVVYGDGPTEDVTVQETDGFEDGDYTSSPTWNEPVANGTATVQTSTVKNGSNALEIATSGSGDHILQHDRGTSDSIDDGDTYTAWVRPASNEYTEFYLTNTSGSSSGNDVVLLSFNFDTASVLDFITRDGSGFIISSETLTTKVSSGNWYRLEIELNPSQSEAKAEVYDSSNILIASNTVSSSGASNLQYVDLRKADASQNSSYFDDVSYSASNTETIQIPKNEENVTGTWGNTGQNAVMVQHLQDDPLTATDSTSNNNDGTVTGATSTSGQFDSAASFDGTDDEIEFTDSNSLNPSDITLVTFVKAPNLADTNSNVKQFSKFDSSNKDYELLTQGDNLRYAYADGGVNSDTVTLQNNTWTHLAATDNGSSIDFYKDGSNVGTVSGGGPGDTGISLYLGRDGRSNYFELSLDAARIYSEKKNDTWMQADYDASPKAGQVFFSQQAAQQTSTDKTASIPETQLTSTNPDPQVNAFNSVTVQETKLTQTTVNPQVQSGTATITVTETQLTSTNPDVNLQPGKATIQAQNPTNLTVSNPDFQINSPVDVTVPETQLAQTTPNPSVTEGQTILTPETQLTQTTPDIQVLPGTSTVQVLETQLTANNPEIALNRTIVFGTVTQLTASNPEPSLEPGIVQVNVPETQLTQTTENPGVSPGETTVQVTPPTDLLVAKPTISVTGGPTTLSVDTTELTVTNPDTNVAIDITPRDESKSFNIDKSETVTVSGDIDK